MSIQCKECGPVSTFDLIVDGKQIEICEHGNEVGRGTNSHAYDVNNGTLHCNSGGHAVEIINVANDIRSQMSRCTQNCPAPVGAAHVCIPGARCQHG